MNAECVATTEQTKQALAPLRGLTQAQARERLRQFGRNDPTGRRRGALALELTFLFLNPLVVILLLASVVSPVLGQTVDAAIVFLMVLLGVTINFVQTYRSHRAVEKLREYVSLTATVLRDSTCQEASTVTYLILVEAAKRVFFSREMGLQAGTKRGAR